MNSRLRELRKKRGVSLAFVAEKLGYSHPSGYANIEYGLSRLRLDQAKIIADIYNVPLEELIS